jgi:hypothetical protein
LSWRKRLAGLATEPPDSQIRSFEDTQSDTEGSRAGVSYVIPGPNTTDWSDPGIFGMNQDEGKDAPDLNSPGLVCICEMYETRTVFIHSCLTYHCSDMPDGRKSAFFVAGRDIQQTRCSRLFEHIFYSKELHLEIYISCSWKNVSLYWPLMFTTDIMQL